MYFVCLYIFKSLSYDLFIELLTWRDHDLFGDNILSYSSFDMPVLWLLLSNSFIYICDKLLLNHYVLLIIWGIKNVKINKMKCMSLRNS